MRIFTTALLLFVISFGAVKLWFFYTDGFRLAHISSELKPDSRWKTRELTEEEKLEVDVAISQSYTYMGKGCQSYAFLSEDGQYIIKFLKYQRFRPQYYFYWFTFLKEFKQYLDLKIDLKVQKMERLFTSWVVAFDLLPKETALIYTHLNKTDHLNRSITITDYAGYRYELDMDQMEFLIQKKGELLCPVIDQMMAEGKEEETKTMLSGLFRMIVSEYQRGIADNDHALMQNTGVIDGQPFQLDVGRFVVDPIASNPKIYNQEIYNKYYKFRLWLKRFHPSLLDHVNHELFEEMGEEFYSIQYIPSQ